MGFFFFFWLLLFTFFFFLALFFSVHPNLSLFPLPCHLLQVKNQSNTFHVIPTYMVFSTPREKYKSRTGTWIIYKYSILFLICIAPNLVVQLTEGCILFDFWTWKLLLLHPLLPPNGVTSGCFWNIRIQCFMTTSVLELWGRKRENLNVNRIYFIWHILNFILLPSSRTKFCHSVFLEISFALLFLWHIL